MTVCTVCDDDDLHCNYCKKPHNVSASFSNELLCLMPKELTAENGAKGLLIGEFKENIIIDCTESGEVKRSVFDRFVMWF